MRSMTVLVTGGTGFIGRSVVQALALRHDVICVVRDPARLANLGRMAVVQADLSRSPDVRALPRRADAVIHLAQANRSFPDGADELFAVNLAATQWLAGYARRAGVSRFVYASTGNVYAKSVAALKETDPIQPDSFAAVTKYSAEQLLRWYQEDFPVCVLRLFTPYGPSQTDRVIPRLIQAVREGRPVVVTNGGQPRLNPIFIDDVVRVMEQALQLACHDVINVGGPDVAGLDTIATRIGELVGRLAVFEHRTQPLTWNLIGDTEKMRSRFALGELVRLAEGLRRTVGQRAPAGVAA